MLYNHLDESKFRNKLNVMLDRLDKKLSNCNDEEKIVRVVYDLIAQSVEPDYDALDGYLALDLNDEATVEDFVVKHVASFNAYGAIVNGRATCMGVAQAYKLILDNYRVEATSVMGLYDNTSHMLNVVELEGDKYYVDVSRALVQENLPMVRYDCFLVGKDRIATYFVPNKDLGCVDNSRRTYFAKNYLEFKNGMDLRKYLTSFTYEKTNGDIRFFYKGNTFDNDDLEKITEDIISVRCGREYRIVGYSVNDGIGNCKITKRD